MGDDRRAYARERQNAVGEVVVDDLFRHSIDDAVEGVLGEDVAALLFEGTTALQAISAHAGHDHSQSLPIEHADSGAKKVVHRRAAAVLGVIIGELDDGAMATTPELHLLAAGCDDYDEITDWVLLQISSGSCSTHPGRGSS